MDRKAELLRQVIQATTDGLIRWDRLPANGGIGAWKGHTLIFDFPHDEPRSLTVCDPDSHANLVRVDARSSAEADGLLTRLDELIGRQLARPAADHDKERQVQINTAEQEARTLDELLA